MSRTFVILNPNSGKGRGRRLEPRIREVFGGDGVEFGLIEVAVGAWWSRHINP